MRTLFSLLCLLFFGAVQALELPEILGPHAVLQQDHDVLLWGWAKSGSIVCVSSSWGKSASSRTDSNGRWKMRIRTPKASFKPQMLTIKGDGQRLVLDDILIGEVWFCSGQSNMVMPLMGLRNCPTREGNEEIALSSRYAGSVRVATIPQDQSVCTEPQTRVHGQWALPSPEAAPDFSAVAWFYATTLTQMLNVPVGVIVCAWGGSRVEGWLPNEYLRQCAPDEDLSGHLDSKGPNRLSMELPAIMYNGMLHPVMGYTIRGFLWFQGESNVNRGLETYSKRFADMVAIWRERWRQPGDSLPFYTVEISPHWYRNPMGIEAALLREQQHDLAVSVPNSGCVCTNDLMEDFEVQNVHGSIKRPIGQRLAYMAAVRTYGIGDERMCDAPTLDSVRYDSKKEVTLVFHNADNGFSRFTNIPGFEAAGKDGVFHPAQVGVTRIYNELKLSCPDVPDAILSVRYNFKNWAPGRVWNTRGLPIVPFRTDRD